jgi:hypothetical protein
MKRLARTTDNDRHHSRRSDREDTGVAFSSLNAKHQEHHDSQRETAKNSEEQYPPDVFDNPIDHGAFTQTSESAKMAICQFIAPRANRSTAVRWRLLVQASNVLSINHHVLQVTSVRLYESTGGAAICLEWPNLVNDVTGVGNHRKPRTVAFGIGHGNANVEYFTISALWALPGPLQGILRATILQRPKTDRSILDIDSRILEINRVLFD